MLQVGDLPPELTTNPLAYVALAGLDITTNAVHRAIWESFTANSPDRAPLFLKLVPDGYEFPSAKPKKTVYEWYVPKGILKTNWMSKHLMEMPSVIVQFIELEWDSPAWSEKRVECATKLESLRASLQGRSTRVALVLIQKRAALPGTDDQIASERAAFLCSSCDLSGKTLFVLPHSDHLFGYTLRLQSAFYELAQTYYNHECRRIKNHKEHLNKTTHQLLFVRHQFKIAFLSELKHDIGTALKNYKQAYANLMEVRATDANILEIKTIAGFINYKTCRLSFLNGTPLDAIAQFRNHIDIFKSKIGPAELSFEHSAWMSKQFSHFGDLFEEAVQQGLNAIQTQHPGFYYQQAANHAVTRKLLCHKLCKSVQEAENLDLLKDADNMEFFGQRPWRPCCQSLEPPDPQLELEGINVLKYQEFHDTDHSMTIIPLLSSAVAQFKKYKCPRMKRQLTVEMGEEYYFSKDYSKALTLLKHVLWDYRAEKWRPIVSNILWTALKCAYLSANVQEYINLGLESISHWIIRSSEEKAAIQSSFSHLLQGKYPAGFPDVSEEETEGVQTMWTDSISALVQPFILTIQMASIVPFIECKAGFASADYTVDQRLSIDVYLRINCPQPMTFSKLTVLFNNPYYNKFCEIPAASVKEHSSDQDVNGCQLHLVPRNTHMYTFNFVPDTSDINQNIQITSVALQLGSEERICAVLHWICSGSDAALPHISRSHFVTKTASFSDDQSFQQIASHSSTKILPRNAKILLNLRHEMPALVGEFYAFIVEITNEEVDEIDQVVLSVGLTEGQQQVIHDNTHLSEDVEISTQFVQFLPKISLKKMLPGEKISKKIFMKANVIGLRKFFFEVTYNINVEIDEQRLLCSCNMYQSLEVPVVEPFEFSVKVLNMKYQAQTSLRAEEPFLLKIDINTISSIPVTLIDGILELDKNVQSVDGSLVSEIQNLPLKPQEAGTECFCLIIPQGLSTTPLGTYHLKWKRISMLDDFAVIETTINLLDVDVTSPPIFMELDFPAHGWVRTPMTVTYFLHNRLLTVQDVELLIDTSDAFMYAGNKQVHFRVLPRDKYKLTYNLYPLRPGYVPLPRIRMTLNPGTSSALSVDELVKDMIPTHIFVMPQGKSNADDSSRTT